MEMSNKISGNESRIIYLSIFLVIALAILLGFSNDQIYSSATILLIVVIIVGNAIYFYGRMRGKPKEKMVRTS